MCKINGKKLKEIREREGLTLQDVAKGCGVSYSTISKYESEINNPSDATVDKICLLLKINKNDIEVSDVGYSFTQGISRTVDYARRKKRLCSLFDTTSDRGICTGTFKRRRINGG